MLIWHHVQSGACTIRTEHLLMRRRLEVAGVEVYQDLRLSRPDFELS